MKLTIKGKNIRVTNAIKKYAEKKFNKLDDFFENIVEASLEIEIEKGARSDKHKAHIVIKLPKHIVLKGEAKSNDMYATIDDLEAKMSTVIKRQHEKFKKHKVKDHKNLFKQVMKRFSKNVMVPEPDKAKEDHDIEISIDKKTTAKPMDPVEAVLQLSKTRLKFYTFHNTKVHHQLNVVYERPDGTYGLQTDKKQYLKRAHLTNFKNQPVKEKKIKTGVKITKIKEINSKELTLEKAVESLMKKADYHFLPFTNKDSGRLNIIYKASPNKVKVIEPAIVS